MTEKIKRINNPLTIIAIFAALAEVNATVAIGLIEPELQNIFIWFVMGFPSLLVILFFCTLNFNTKVMYSPSDYKDDKTFLDSLYGNPSKTSLLRYEFDRNELVEKVESKIVESVEKVFKEERPGPKDTEELNKKIEKIRESINEITNESIRKVFLPIELKNTLLEWKQFPAYYLLINAILKTGANTIKSIEEASKKYFIPGKWEEVALPELEEKGIIRWKTKEAFEMNQDYLDALSKWISHNYTVISSIEKELKITASADDNEKSRQREKIRLIADRLIF